MNYGTYEIVNLGYVPTRNLGGGPSVLLMHMHIFKITRFICVPDVGILTLKKFYLKHAGRD